MAAPREKNANHWQDWGNLTLAAWLFISPWVLGYAVGADAAAVNAWIFGVIVASMAGAALMRARPWEEWVNMAIGAWLVISPWVLGFSGRGGAAWNAVIVGFLVLVLAAWDLRAIRQTRMNRS